LWFLAAKAKFDEMCLKFESELNILLKTPVPDIASKFGEKIAEGIAKVRKGDIIIEPGYDGEYGKVKIWNSNNDTKGEKLEMQNQMGLKF